MTFQVLSALKIPKIVQHTLRLEKKAQHSFGMFFSEKITKKGPLETLGIISPLIEPLWDGRTRAHYGMEKPGSFHKRPSVEK